MIVRVRAPWGAGQSRPAPVIRSFETNRVRRFSSPWSPSARVTVGTLAVTERELARVVNLARYARRLPVGRA